MVLQAAPGDQSATQTVDGTVAEGVAYRYVAVRRRTVQIGGRTLLLESAPSAPVELTWRDVYPPPTPTRFAGLGYSDPAGSTQPGKTVPEPFAVDLVWQPVSDPRLAGYLLYRQRVNPAGEPLEAAQRLTAEPVLTPGFHDATALPGERYRYGVTAIDPKGNESSRAETIVEPTPAPTP